MIKWLIWNSANLITFSRIIITPIIVFVVSWENYFEEPWDIGVVVVAYVLLALTDRLDGSIARKIGNTEGIGKVLDPIADKLMHVYGLTFLWTEQLLEPWVIILITGGEIIVFGIVIRGMLLMEKIERKKYKTESRVPMMEKKYWIYMYRLVKEKLINDVVIDELGRIKMGFFFLGYSVIAINIFFGPARVYSFFYLAFFFAGILLSYYADFRYYDRFEKWEKENFPEN